MKNLEKDDMAYILICSNKYMDRKDKSLNMLREHGINNVVLSDSVFIDKFPSDINERKWIGKNKKTLGCYFAHKNAISSVLKINKHVMIMEDDILITHLFDENIEEIYSVLEKEMPSMFFLSNYSHSLSGNFKFLRSPKRITNTQCYIIHKNYKEKILSHMNLYYGAMDRILFCYEGTKYHCKPSLVLQRGDASIIKEENKRLMDEGAWIW